MKARTALSTLFVTALFAGSVLASNPPPGPQPTFAKADLVPIPDPTSHSWTFLSFNNQNQSYITIAVKNQGLVDAGPFKAALTFYRSLGADPVTVIVPFAGLKKGFFGYQLVPLPYGWGTGPNMNMLKFTMAVDSGDQVSESNEVNNFQLVYALPYAPAP
jgi:hypothetical protein